VTDLFNQTTTIKAITLWQPWASLIAAGVKRHETRSWATSYRGPIAIHAGQTIDVAGAPEALCAAALGANWRRVIPVGMILAVGELTACVEASRLAPSLTTADREAGNFEAGRFAWRIDNMRPLAQPVPATGRQGLWNWSAPRDLGAHLRPVLNHAAQARYIGWA